MTRATAAATAARSLGNTDRMAAEDLPTLRAPWPEVISALVAAGWARVPRAVDPAPAARLGEDDGRVWRVAGDEGVVRQHVLGSYTPYREALPLVRAVGDCLVAGLSAEAGRRDLPPVPLFNEVTWGRYPAGTGHITAHRDPATYGGVVAVLTLSGYAAFRVWDANGEVTEWDTGPGQLTGRPPKADARSTRSIPLPTASARS